MRRVSRRLSRYLAGQYAAMLGLCLIGLVGLLVGTTLVEHAAALASQPAAATDLGRLCLTAAIGVGYQNFPAAALLSALLCGAMLARRGEILAVQAAGGAPWQVAAPWGAVVLIAALACFLLGEYGVPFAVRQTRQMVGPLRPAIGTPQAPRSAWFLDGDFVLYLPEVDEDSQGFCHPTVYRRSAGQLQEVIEARRLVYRDGWFLEDVQRRFVATPQVARCAAMPLALRVAPQDLLDSAGDPQLLRLGELNRLIGRRQRAGYDVTAHRLAAQHRLAQPLSGFLLAFLALPLALRPRQRGSLGRALGSGAILLGLYLALEQLCRLAALDRSVAVFWGAWGAPAGAALLALAAAAAPRLAAQPRAASRAMSSRQRLE